MIKVSPDFIHIICLFGPYLDLSSSLLPQWHWQFNIPIVPSFSRLLGLCPISECPNHSFCFHSLCLITDLHTIFLPDLSVKTSPRSCTGLIWVFQWPSRYLALAQNCTISGRIWLCNVLVYVSGILMALVQVSSPSAVFAVDAAPSSLHMHVYQNFGFSSICSSFTIFKMNCFMEYQRSFRIQIQLKSRWAETSSSKGYVHGHPASAKWAFCLHPWSYSNVVEINGQMF